MLPCSCPGCRDSEVTRGVGACSSDSGVWGSRKVKNSAQGLRGALRGVWEMVFRRRFANPCFSGQGHGCGKTIAGLPRALRDDLGQSPVQGRDTGLGPLRWGMGVLYGGPVPALYLYPTPRQCPRSKWGPARGEEQPGLREEADRGFPGTHHANVPRYPSRKDTASREGTRHPQHRPQGPA